jgi:general nucleoside transport system ATP-binding protein
MRGIRKAFGAVQALDGVDLDLRPGEIHALLGENGAGKSTLMHVLNGQIVPDRGSVEVGDRPVRPGSQQHAARAGIAMVHQHFTLVDNFTVAENLALQEEGAGFLLPRREVASAALAQGESLGWRFRGDTPVWQLSVGMQQRLEILKALSRRPRVLILDEPTAVLAPIELPDLFAVLRRLRDEGTTIVFISHKLREVLELSDRISVLRRGRLVRAVDAAGTTAEALAGWMIGGEADAPVGEPWKTPPAASSETLLEIQDLRVRDDRGHEAVRGLSLEVRAGEILGLAGVDGNGQSELAEAIAGIRAIAGGRILSGGRKLLRRDIGFIPPDRRRMGLVAALSVRDNLILDLHQDREARWGPFLRWGYLNAAAERMRREFEVGCSDLFQPVETLSGGNQQKIVVARALFRRPHLIVAANPTRGLDVAAAAYVQRHLRAAAAEGAAVLLISTELDEVLQGAHRVGVLYEGRVAGWMGPGASREHLGRLMGGAEPTDA